MRAVDLIRKKRDGGEFSGDEIRFLVAGLGDGTVPTYQWSALTMAIYWRGMTAAETAALVDAMLHSGTVLDLADIPGPKVDKHSTGGVGDKTSLILAPIAAACGVTVPMVSGRGLGHTGGTLDKLESIPGFRIDLDLDAYRRVARECGLVLVGQTAEIAPADRVLYALRDATATVESIPLITASILSKKLAEGIDALVLDVKTGDGAFMKSYDDSSRLARKMASIGRAMGKSIVALITRMDQPLGYAVGNSLEVIEAIDCLRGNGPADLVDLSVELAAEMLLMGRRANSLPVARDMARSAIADGSALERFARVIAAQGGDPRVCEDPSLLPSASLEETVVAERSGHVNLLRAAPIGLAAMLLGAGRHHAESPIDPGAGILLLHKQGDHVERGAPLARLLFNPDHAHALPRALEHVREAFVLGDQPPEPVPIVIERLGT
jgi:pyrimidine-nucleoside phosphorylase